MALANAINMADGKTPIPSDAPKAPVDKQNGTSFLPPELVDAQRANDKAAIDTVAKAQAAQKALQAAQKALQDAQSAAATATYVYGPGSKEADAANALVDARKTELAAALAKVGEIPDYSGIDPKTVQVSGSGIVFSYNLNGQKVQVSGSLKNGTGTLFDEGTLATYTYENGKLVATKFLDPGQAQATVERLFTAVTAPLGVGPVVKGGEAAYLGLRGLFAKESIEALAGTSSDNILGHGLELATARAASATDHLAAAGPGSWVVSHENFSPVSRAYQEFITGRSIDEAYFVNGKKFDDFVDGYLIDAKADYQQFVDKGAWDTWFQGDRKFLDEAFKQSTAAGGTPIRWYFMQDSMAARIESLLERNNIHNIECIWVPMQ